jgi:uncharacterized tellurite resistance protein B-like protein
MSLRRLFGGKPEPEIVERPAPVDETDTETVRRIVAQLEALPLEERKLLAGAAYILVRVANADLSFSDAEVAAMEQLVRERGELSEAQAVLVVEIARNQAELYGGTEDYLVTRAFAASATPEQRERLLRYAFAIAASDGSISALESAELNEVGKELGFATSEVDAIRLEHREQLAAVQQMRATIGDSAG